MDPLVLIKLSLRGGLKKQQQQIRPSIKTSAKLCPRQVSRHVMRFCTRFYNRKHLNAVHCL